mmetsp:Transcript_12090/g.23943  ORF Transcript_12090/g.23943 Transcript_12090/m.23943 type:complete len:117 (-) Transcript_12090:62-412(-)
MQSSTSSSIKSEGPCDCGTSYGPTAVTHTIIVIPEIVEFDKAVKRTHGSHARGIEQVEESRLRAKTTHFPTESSKLHQSHHRIEMYNAETKPLLLLDLTRITTTYELSGVFFDEMS